MSTNNVAIVTHKAQWANGKSTGLSWWAVKCIITFQVIVIIIIIMNYEQATQTGYRYRVQVT